MFQYLKCLKTYLVKSHLDEEAKTAMLSTRLLVEKTIKFDEI